MAASPVAVQLANLFQESLSGDSSRRSAVSAAVQDILRDAAGTVACFELICTDAVPASVRQSAAVTLKNRYTRSELPEVPEADNVIRANMLRSLTVCPPNCREFLANITAMLLGNGCANWPDLNTSLLTHMQMQEPRAMTAALLVLHRVMARLNNSTSEHSDAHLSWHRAFLPGLCDMVTSVLTAYTAAHAAALAARPSPPAAPTPLPGSASMAKQLKDVPAEHLATLAEYGQIIKLCTKIFGVVAVRPLTKVLTENNLALLRSWMTALAGVLLAAPPSREDDEEDPVVSARKNVCEVFKDITNNATTCARMASKSSTDIGTILAEVSPTMVQCVMQLFTMHTLDLPTKVIHRGLLFLFHALRVKSKAIYRIVTDAKALEHLVQQVVFPVLQWTDEDEESYESDPHEFITRPFMIEKAFYSLKNIGTYVLDGLTSVQYAWHDSQVLNAVLTFLQSKVSTYLTVMAQPEAAAALSPAQAKAMAKDADGALTGLAALGENMRLYVPGEKQVKGKKSRMKPVGGVAPPPHLLKTVMPSIFRTVGPLLGAPQPLLRCSAAQAAQVFLSYADFEDPAVLEAAPLLIQRLLEGMASGADHLPVKVFCGLALRQVVQKGCQPANDALRPHVKELTRTYISMLGQVDVGELASCVSQLVTQYTDDLAPYVLDTLRQLVGQFVRLATDANKAVERAHQEEIDDDSAGMQPAAVAASCIAAMITILKAVDEFPMIYEKAEEILLPLFEGGSLDVELVDYLENVLELISIVLYVHVDNPEYTRPVSVRMWGVFLRVVKAYFSFADGYITDMTAALDNFLSADVKGFLQGPSMPGETVSPCSPGSAWEQMHKVIFPDKPVQPPVVHLHSILSRESETARGALAAMKLVEPVYQYAKPVDPAFLVSSGSFAAYLGLVVRVIGSGVITNSPRLQEQTWHGFGAALWCDATNAMDMLMKLPSGPVAQAALSPEGQPVTLDARALFQAYIAYIMSELKPEDDDMSYAKKVVCLGLAEMLHAIARMWSLPAPLLSTPQEVKMIADTTVRLALESFDIQKKNVDRGSDYDEDDSDASESVMEGDDEDAEDATKAGAKAMASAAAAQSAMDVTATQQGGVHVVSEEQAFEIGELLDDDSQIDEGEYTSPIDDVNETVHLDTVIKAIAALAEANPQSAAAMVSAALREATTPHMEHLTRALTFGHERISEVSKDREERTKKLHERLAKLQYLNLDAPPATA
eukprot:TRINITY_DN12307_c0_g1_i1.p1 TRINITY_DN12307_c0_g1~~TRINITY_DN12307_c0_g1_i1.p1  ORF type:complete len:1221 (+),score=410.55 TRINITY_DN12307_c0_g1_i1:51-3713(+)